MESRCRKRTLALEKPRIAAGIADRPYSFGQYHLCRAGVWNRLLSPDVRWGADAALARVCDRIGAIHRATAAQKSRFHSCRAAFRDYSGPGPWGYEPCIARSWLDWMA